MKNKIIAVLLLVVVLNVSLVFAASTSQTSEQGKGGFNFAVENSRGKPSGKPSGGISTGNLASEVTGTRYAIVIGINYVDTPSELRYCVNDASEFRDALLDNGWKSGQITYLVDGTATKDAIYKAIMAVKGAGPDDEVVFFYSGHGTISNYDADDDGEKRDEAIIPVELTSSKLIWDGNLKTWFDGCEARMMFFFDSCYSGGMNDLAAPNRLICMACGENQLSLESSAWQNHGQFTYYFVDQGIVQGLADKDQKNGVTFEEAFDYASIKCQRQTPVASDGVDGDMLP